MGLGGILKSVGSTITGGLFDDPVNNPDRGPSNISGKAGEIQEDQKKRADLGVQEITDNSLQNVDRSSDLSRAQEDMSRKQSALGGEDRRIFQEALNRKANRAYGIDLSKIKRAAREQADVTKSENQSAYTRNAQRYYDFQRGTLERDRQQVMQDQQARNGAISSVLGLAGSIAGRAIGGK
jgi:hypothetical protein